MDKMIKDSKG
jgi:T-complex protein 1 subunit delta